MSCRNGTIQSIIATMKTKLRDVLLAFTMAGAVSAQSPSPCGVQPPAINVTGQAELKVAPDLVDLRLGVEVIDADLAKAKAMHDKKVAAVLKALHDNGIEDKDVQTDYLAITPRYDARVKSRPDWYSVEKSIQCTVRDIAIFEKVLAAALDAGATTVAGIDFRTTKLREFRDQARVNALKAAREKADLLAGELGMKRGRALGITETQSNGWGWSNRLMNASQNSIQNISSGESSEGFAAGQISVSATVSASFLLE